MSLLETLFGVVSDNQGIFFSLVLLAVFIFALSKFFSQPKPGPNPFKTDDTKPCQPLVTDQNARDKVLKQGFQTKLVPEGLDAVVVGSGIGGLTAAGLLAKAGKKVLVLEQHDQAGGCCHSFVNKGFEFDVGIHYIGEMRSGTNTHLLINQLTRGQLQWCSLDEECDVMVLGEPGKQKFYPIRVGSVDVFRKCLVEKFPKEEKAIDQYLALLKEVRLGSNGLMIVKVLPKWIVRLLCATGLINLMTTYFKYSRKSAKEVLDGLTDNEDLKAMLTCNCGDYGNAPSHVNFFMQAALTNHYIRGAYYPRGGASEIAFHIIPVIESAGGRVLVRAPVSEILTDSDGKAVGVRVSRSSGPVDIKAPLIISDAGVINTFTKLLPQTVARQSDLYRMIDKTIKSSVGCMSVFVGLNGTSEELGLKAQNIWMYASNDITGLHDDYLSSSVEDAMNSDLPMLFVSFPSAKDPTFSERYPGKSACTVVTLANWEWFQQWQDKRVMKRGEDYDAIKMAIGRRMWDLVLSVYPQLADKVEYFDVGTPASNNHYIAAPRGETYGLHHDISRFTNTDIMMNLRSETGIPGLLLAGQDVVTAGFSSAMFSGLMCASVALNRNLYTDLLNLKKELAKTK